MIFSENPPPQEYVFGLHFMVNVMVTVTVNVTVTVTLEFPRKVARNSVDFPRKFHGISSGIVLFINDFWRIAHGDNRKTKG